MADNGNKKNDTGAKKKRPTFGFFVSELENPYAQTLCRGITDAAAAADANVIIFPGKSPKVPYNYRYQYNAIYKLASKNNIDALILATGTMVNFLSDEEFKEFYSRYTDIPLVSISIRIDGISSVLIDNKVGLRDVFEHLIAAHKLEKIAFISGPESNIEAQERFSVYRNALERHGLAFDPNLVVNGDFTKYAGVEAIKEFLDNRGVTFQALAAANDEMALSAMEELQKRGFRIPEDVAIVGFDNVESAHYSSPSLTTVAQPIYEQAYKAVELACQLIDGGEARDVTLPTSMVQRESCGCFSQVAALADASGEDPAGCVETDAHQIDCDTAKVEAILQKALAGAIKGGLDNDGNLELLKELSSVINSVVSDREEKLRSWQNSITDFRARAGLPALGVDTVIRLEDFFHKARMLLLETYFKNDLKRWDIYHNDIVGLRDVLSLLILDVTNTKAALRSIIPNLREMGIACFYVFLHDAAVKHKITTNWNFPKKVTLVVAGDDRLGSSELSGKTMPVECILDSNLYDREERYTFVVSSLFYMEEHIGFVVCEPNFNDIYIFESLIVEISCALKLISLVQTRHKIEERLQNALEELEKYNEHLSSISETDELTELLNRRGFMNHARHMFSMARRMKKDGILFFADLDGLKTINDTYGHEEGDNAIKVTASVLRKTFRESDVLARLGGDEFTVFTLNTNAQMLERFESRIAEFVDDYNQKSGKPYKVSISFGMVPFCHTDKVDVETLMHKADVLLYQQKKEKRRKAAAEVSEKAGS
ncbi:MAG: GGDEF domain-containing protein [Chitinispirillales bacterium]|jgi:diguanylate cyclase (GGDEF)-like protein|nr:GGDEF domain-containing protein [Chitinispirillales bacterium]